MKLKTVLAFGAAIFAAGSLGAQTKEDGAADSGNVAGDTPEAAALSAASKFLDDKEFTLRQDYWKGELTPMAGKALKIQFLPHTTYRLFFAAGAESLPKGAKLRVKIVDRAMNEVASGATKFKSTAAVVKFQPKKTGLYMVLLRVEAPGDVKEDTKIPCVLFYGYE